MSDLDEAVSRMVAQSEAINGLYALVTPRAPMPSMTGWAADPLTMMALSRALFATSPKLVVECGSGASSVWLGYLVQRIGGGRVVCLEHEPEYGAKTRQLLEQHELTDVVEVRDAPLTQHTVESKEFSWYDDRAWQELCEIGLVFVDGPPGGTNALARYPALPLLAPHCTAGGLFLLDDFDRKDENATRRRWIERHGAQAQAQDTTGKGWALVSI